MKIIDAHLHLFPSDEAWAEETAQSVGHHNSIEHLQQVYREIGMVHGVVMGNQSLEKECQSWPANLFHYCFGLDTASLEDNKNNLPLMVEKAEEHLRLNQCCGIKLYPGYNKIPLSDPLYEPFYELAAQYDKPVAVHMGLTAFSGAHMKYCHPMALDEVAADHFNTRFVMCHFGNPFWETAAAVLAKNPNVSTDLSGFLDGRVDLDHYFQEQSGYIFLLKTWLTASCCWDRIMYGTDWPIVNLEEYLRFIQQIIPEQHWDKVLFENANRIYKLGL